MPSACSPAKSVCIGWYVFPRSTKPSERHTSFASVYVSPEIDDSIEVIISRKIFASIPIDPVARADSTSILQTLQCASRISLPNCGGMPERALST